MCRVIIIIIIVVVVVNIIIIIIIIINIIIIRMWRFLGTLHVSGQAQTSLHKS